MIAQDSPPELYRNPFLASAMVNLKLIDTQGGGIKKMIISFLTDYGSSSRKDIDNLLLDKLSDALKSFISLSCAAA